MPGNVLLALSGRADPPTRSTFDCSHLMPRFAPRRNGCKDHTHRRRQLQALPRRAPVAGSTANLTMDALSCCSTKSNAPTGSRVPR